MSEIKLDKSNICAINNGMKSIADSLRKLSEENPMSADVVEFQKYSWDAGSEIKPSDIISTWCSKCHEATPHLWDTHKLTCQKCPPPAEPQKTVKNGK